MIIYYEHHAVIEPCFKLGLSLKEAAAYIGVSMSLFDQMVDDGRMPQPVRINARVVWDRKGIEEAWGRLVGGGGATMQATDSWDENLPAAMRKAG